MSDQPEHKPGKALIPYTEQFLGGRHYRHFAGDMPPYPDAMPRAKDMRLLAPLPISLEGSIFSSSNLPIVRGNMRALALWLQEYQRANPLPLAHKPKADAMTTCYTYLASFQDRLSRKSTHSDQVLRFVFPASFTVPLHHVRVGEDLPPYKSVEAMLIDLEAMHETFTKLMRFPAPKSVNAAHTRGIDEFRTLLKKRIIPQIERAQAMETALLEKLESQLAPGESQEVEWMKNRAEREVRTWLDSVSKPPSQDRGKS